MSTATAKEGSDGGGDERERRGDVTRILARVGAATPAAGDAARLLEITYAELRRLAAQFLASERADHTLQPTALVHEAWMRLADQDRIEWRGRAHFLGVAAQAMRRILVDHARAKQRHKRGGAWKALDLDPDELGPAGEEPLDLVALDAALEKLRTLSPQQAQVVELRFFGGLEMAEVARVVGVSLRTTEREWRFARAWLENELRRAGA